MNTLTARIREASRRPASFAAEPGTVSLALGEPCEATPASVVDAACVALKAGRTRYAPMTGSQRLQDRLAGHLSERHRRAIPASRIVLTHGGSAGLASAILALVNPGDRVVIPEPTYSLYADHVALANGIVDWVAPSPGDRCDIPRTLEKLGGARLLILCNPGNPTGLLLDRRSLDRLCLGAARAGAYVLADEAYSDLIFDDRGFDSVLDLHSQTNVLACGTFSKTYAMTGWRLGYVVAPEPVASEINLIHRTFNGPLNTFVQDAAEAALELPADGLERLRAAYQDRRDIVLERLGTTDLKFTPSEGAFYTFVRYRAPWIKSEDLTRQLAQTGVLVRAGSEYGPSGEGAFRLSFAATKRDLERGLDRILSTIDTLTKVGDQP